jgi:ABC-type oligopeptide transport system substrate-binding subunit/class 3 adenylate cyclase
MTSVRSELPSGTVTFLFTDIEGSTGLLKKLGDKYADVLADQRRIFREIFTRWHGQEVDTQGDSFFISFPRATDAIAAAVEAQKALAKHAWPEGVKVRVRMGLHTGEPFVAQEGYVGMAVHRAARIGATGHGGQVLLSGTTTQLILDDLPDDVSLLDLGRHRLKDMRRPEHISQLVIDGLPSEFPALKSLEALPLEIALESMSVRSPVFLESELVDVSAPVFVGRERELERLEGFLMAALTGEGTVAFVTGGPGRGKTALMDAFTRQIMARHANLLVARGSCNAHTGVGDPYLPFREVMEMLTGNLEARWIAGRIQRENAIRLWEAMPKAIQALVEHGPDLIDVFVSGNVLLACARAAVEGGRSWIERLATLCVTERKSPGELQQRNLFEQYEDVLGKIAEEYPLILMLDDLQWGDSASINLLFHLSRELAGKRILIVCAYRPEEVTLGRGGEVHPLEKVLSEIKQLYGDVWVDLSEVSKGEGRRFVEVYLDSEPNRLSEDFRQALYEHTGGHPLFTVELLRNLQEREDLVKDDEGKWTEGSSLDWSILPARVEGVIEERIGCLEEELRETLRIACIEGENFTAQVVARVQEVGELQLFGKLNRELEKRHRLIHSRGEAKVGEQIINQYAFTHALFQQFLYNGLSIGERRLMHGEVARILEELYAGDTESVAVQLAHHYTEAQQAEQAIHYLQLAGDQARMMYAHEDAIRHYERALHFLKERGDFEYAARTLMKVGLTFHTAFDYQRSRRAYEEGFVLRLSQNEFKSPAPLPLAPHPLRIHFKEPWTLDPCHCPTYHTVVIVKELFCGLVQINPDMSVLPDVAHSWEIFDSGRRYVFHLRDDAHWSDGESVTAYDFEFALKRFLDPKIGASLAYVLYDIKGAKAFNKGIVDDPTTVKVQARDKYTLDMELEEPAGYFLQLLAVAVGALPVPQHVLRTWGEAWIEVENIVTNGPFILKQWERGRSMVLVRNPKYHDQFSGNLDAIEFLFSPYPSNRLEVYESDQLDVTTLGFEETLRVRQRHSDEYRHMPGLFTFFIGFNVKEPPFNDPQVRRAFTLATDRESFANVVLEGYHFPATGGIVPPGIPGHSAEIGLPYDPQEACMLLNEAGYGHRDGFPTLEILTSGKIGFGEQHLQSQWKEILGIEVTWNYKDYPSFLELMEKCPPRLFLYAWTAGYPDPDSFLRMCPLQRYTGWQNDSYTKLIETARSILDQPERMRIYQQAERILIQEAPILPIFYGRDHILVKPWVKNLNISPFGKWFFKDAIIEPH